MVEDSKAKEEVKKMRLIEIIDKDNRTITVNVDEIAGVIKSDEGDANIVMKHKSSLCTAVPYDDLVEKLVGCE